MSGCGMPGRAPCLPFRRFADSVPWHLVVRRARISSAWSFGDEKPTFSIRAYLRRAVTRTEDLEVSLRHARRGIKKTCQFASTASNNSSSTRMIDTPGKSTRLPGDSQANPGILAIHRPKMAYAALSYAASCATSHYHSALAAAREQNSAHLSCQHVPNLAAIAALCLCVCQLALGVLMRSAPIVFEGCRGPQR